MSPKNYISWSQLSTWERSPEEYRRKYILGEREPSNKYMEFGKMFAELMESGKEPEDAKLKHILNFMPKYPLREHKFNSFCHLENNKKLELYCIFDCFEPTEHLIGEIKTGKNWNQKKADKHGQLTFYAYAYWLKLKKIPYLELIWVRTEETNEGIQTTGDVEVFETERKMPELLSMHTRIEKAWSGIKSMYESEVNNILK